MNAKERNIENMPYMTDGINGGRVLVNDGYRYQKNKTSNTSISWRCWKKTCRATLTSNIFDVFDDDAQPHVNQVRKY